MIFSAEIQSTMFENTYISLWWSLITMTTIGYGDFYPTTTYGYIVGMICAVNGIVVLALPIAAIAGTFSNMFSRNADYQRHKTAATKQIEFNNKSDISPVKDQNILNTKENIDLCPTDNGDSGDVKSKQVNERQFETCLLPTINC
jgi:hypothetical protein